MHDPESANPWRKAAAFAWPAGALALCFVAVAASRLSQGASSSPVLADNARSSWDRPVAVKVEPAPAEEIRCNEPTEPDQSVKQDPPAVQPPARVHPDPLTGDSVKRAPVAKGCACAALDPACACLPLASPCPVPGGSPDGPCRYF
jgi:hypothetical protein